MSERHHEAVKLAASRELGVEGINDPNELREFVSAKWATMDAAERIAFQIQLGRAAQELEHGRPPSRVSYAVAVLAVVGISWLIWRPIALVALVYAIAGRARRFTMRNAPFWAPSAAVILGSGYGVLVATIVVVANIWVFQSSVAHVLLGTFGLYAVAYIGYSVGGATSFELGGDRKTLAQGAAVTAYLFVLIAKFLIAALVHRG